MRLRTAIVAVGTAAILTLGLASSTSAINHFDSWNGYSYTGTETSNACVQGNIYNGRLVQSYKNNCENRVYLQGPPHNPFSYCIEPDSSNPHVPTQYQGPKQILIGRAQPC